MIHKRRYLSYDFLIAKNIGADDGLFVGHYMTLSFASKGNFATVCVYVFIIVTLIIW
jgi:hypothetical protein